MKQMAKKKQKAKEKKSNKTILYVGLAVLFIAAMAIYFISNPSQKPQDTTQDIFQPAPGKVKVVEFMKFDCIHCYNLHNEMPQILKKYGNKVQIVYVPIVFPGQSTKSIEAYIIAQQMGKGENMSDALFTAKFEKGLDIMESTSDLENVAASIGLGTDFNSKLEGKDAEGAARANLALMTIHGVDSTPTIFVNGKQIGPLATDLDTSINATLSSLPS
jgi:thiol:disulfide interchange protein DsbA